MDQFVSCHGIENHALLLDCRSLEAGALPLPAGIHLVICNTGVKHASASGEYNKRRLQCEEAVRVLSKLLPGIRALRDVSVERLEKYRDALSGICYRRARHVVTENERVIKTAQAIESANFQELQPLMAESHRSLRDDYEVSCAELDSMVEIALRQPGVFGARMTGGGFGGCTINLVAEANVPDFEKNVRAEYAAITGISPDIYNCQASQGAEQVSLHDAEWEE
jgi:galactokinase